jgi:hypothetical protein
MPSGSVVNAQVSRVTTVKAGFRAGRGGAARVVRRRARPRLLPADQSGVRPEPHWRRPPHRSVTHQPVVWSFPFTSSPLAPTPAASTLLEGTFAQRVGGLGGYVWWNDLVYTEVSGYQNIPKNAQSALGLDTTDVTKLSGTAPYWRLALQQNWGPHSVEVGTYGLLAHTFPGSDQSAGSDYLSAAADVQYQYLDVPHRVSFQATWIHERQQWRASQPLGLTVNAIDTFQNAKAKVSYLYDSTYGLTLGAFAVYGEPDAGLYQPPRSVGAGRGARIVMAGSWNSIISRCSTIPWPSGYGYKPSSRCNT